MTMEEAIVILGNERPCCGEKVTYTESERCEAYDMAISALREQEERSKGCEFCCYTEFPDKKLYPKENDGFDFYAGAWKRVADDDFIEAETDHIKLCPLCGRRLEDTCSKD